jgi:hypothetical protein
MKEEYKNSLHFKRKTEEFKLNKLMGRIRKKAKGPNPLSIKKKIHEDLGREADISAKPKRKRQKKKNT